ncbi:MAG: lipopolysaccharide biosynthesis protein [Victivallales bacterium]
MSKAQQSFKIFVCGIIAQAVTLGLGILIPRLVIVNYGSEVNGLLSSIRQIFVYVALLEAGIGMASLQALYAPVARHDHRGTSAILAATHHYYRRTGFLYALCVLILAVVYPLVVKSNISFSVAAGVILLQGASGVINYFYQGKFAILLRVAGKSYITTNAATVVNIASKAAQITLILSGFNIVAVQTAYFIVNLAQMVYIAYYIREKFPWLNLKEKPDYAALSQSKNVIVHNVSGLIFNNTDIILLTGFCGLTVVSVYSLYSLLLSCVAGIIDTLCSSVEFILGQAFHSNREYFMKLQETYETYYLAISFSMFTISLILLPPFLKLYTAGITDANYIDNTLLYLFIILYVLMYARRTSSQIINFAGHFKQTQWRSILESGINLGVSIILVKPLGMYGVLLGTIAALLYRTNDIIIYANWNILGRKPWQTYRRWGQNLLLMFLCFLCIKKLLPEIDSYMMLAVHGICVSAACMFTYFIVDSLFDRESFRLMTTLVKNNLFHRLKHSN